MKKLFKKNDNGWGFYPISFWGYFIVIGYVADILIVGVVLNIFLKDNLFFVLFAAFVLIETFVLDRIMRKFS